MFRIDRNLVHLATARSVQLEGLEGEEISAGAEAVCLNASVSAAYAAQEMIKQAETKANQVLERARNEAAELIITAREEAEEERRRGWHEGYSEGAEELKRAFKEKYDEKTKKDADMFKRVIGELYAEREKTYAGLENEVVELSLEIVKKIIGPAEEEAGGVFESLIRHALRQIAPEGKIIIRVSSTEYEKFFSSGSAFFELDKGVKVTTAVLRDASLAEGDCIIDTEDETVNAGIDTQLKYIKIAFNRAAIDDK